MKREMRSLTHADYRKMTDFLKEIQSNAHINLWPSEVALKVGHILRKEVAPVSIKDGCDDLGITLRTPQPVSERTPTQRVRLEEVEKRMDALELKMQLMANDLGGCKGVPVVEASQPLLRGALGNEV